MTHTKLNSGYFPLISTVTSELSSEEISRYKKMSEWQLQHTQDLGVSAICDLLLVTGGSESHYEKLQSLPFPASFTVGSKINDKQVVDQKELAAAIQSGKSPYTLLLADGYAHPSFGYILAMEDRRQGLSDLVCFHSRIGDEAKKSNLISGGFDTFRVLNSPSLAPAVVVKTDILKEFGKFLVETKSEVIGISELFFLLGLFLIRKEVTGTLLPLTLTSHSETCSRKYASSRESKTIVEKLRSEAQSAITDKTINLKNVKVLAVIPFKDQVELTIKCLNSLLEQDYESLEICLVSNNSSVNSLTAITEATREASKKITVIEHNEYFNFATLNNIGAQQAQWDYILCINNDVELRGSNVIELLLEPMKYHNVGAVGGTLYFPSGKIQTSGISYRSVGPINVTIPELFAEELREVEATSLALTLISKSAWESVGGLDDVKCPNGYGDVLLGQQLRQQGYKLVVEPKATGTHYESSSRGKNPEDYELYLLQQAGIPLGIYQDVFNTSLKPETRAAEVSSSAWSELVAAISRRPRLVRLITPVAAVVLKILRMVSKSR